MRVRNVLSRSPGEVFVTRVEVYNARRFAMPLPKSVLCSKCRKTYPEGWRRCPYCGHDELLGRREAQARRFMEKKVQEFEQRTGTGTRKREERRPGPSQRPGRGERSRGQQPQRGQKPQRP